MRAARRRRRRSARALRTARRGRTRRRGARRAPRSVWSAEDVALPIRAGCAGRFARASRPTRAAPRDGARRNETTWAAVPSSPAIARSPSTAAPVAVLASGTRASAATGIPRPESTRAISGAWRSGLRTATAMSSGSVAVGEQAGDPPADQLGLAALPGALEQVQGAVGLGGRRVGLEQVTLEVAEGGGGRGLGRAASAARAVAPSSSTSVARSAARAASAGRSSSKVIAMVTSAHSPSAETSSICRRARSSKPSSSTGRSRQAAGSARRPAMAWLHAVASSTRPSSSRSSSYASKSRAELGLVGAVVELATRPPRRPAASRPAPWRSAISASRAGAKPSCSAERRSWRRERPLGRGARQPDALHPARHGAAGSRDGPSHLLEQRREAGHGAAEQVARYRGCRARARSGRRRRGSGRRAAGSRSSTRAKRSRISSSRPDPGGPEMTLRLMVCVDPAIATSIGRAAACRSDVCRSLRRPAAFFRPTPPLPSPCAALLHRPCRCNPSSRRFSRA